MAITTICLNRLFTWLEPSRKRSRKLATWRPRLLEHHQRRKDACDGGSGAVRVGLAGAAVDLRARRHGGGSGNRRRFWRAARPCAADLDRAAGLDRDLYRQGG